MPNNFDAVGIYVDIDAVLDTRFAALVHIDKTKLTAALDGGYFTRSSDDFAGYDRGAFDAVYADRGQLGLVRSALSTEITGIINDFAVRTIAASVSSPLQRQPTLILNIHPYTFSEGEIVDVINAFTHLTKKRLDIQIVDLPRSEVTPSYLKETCAMVVMYDYWLWLDEHTLNGQLKTTRLPLVTLIAPLLLKSAEAVATLNGVDVSDAIEKAVAPFIKLKLLPSRSFSVDIDTFAQHYHPK